MEILELSKAMQESILKHYEGQHCEVMRDFGKYFLLAINKEFFVIEVKKLDFGPQPRKE